MRKKLYIFVSDVPNATRRSHKWDVCLALLNNGGNIDAIYTDFEKAFDKVPHKRLLCKLQAYGITDEIVAWIQDFPCNRNQS